MAEAGRATEISSAVWQSIDNGLRAIEAQYPGAGDTLRRTLCRWFDPGCSCLPAEAASCLTRTGLPVEFAFVWPDGGPRFTADPAPGLSPAVRTALAKQACALEEVPDQLPVLRLLEEWQSAFGATYGSWLGGRPGLTGARFKLYLEVPENAPWHAWEREIIGASPVLPERRVALRMIGLEQETGVVELYYAIRRIYPDEIDLLLHRIGLPRRSQEFVSLLQLLEQRKITAEIPSSNPGFSYSLSPNGGRTFTLYSFAHSLLGGDADIRAGVLRLADRYGWNSDAYRSLSAPVANAHGWKTRHGMVGLTARADGPLRFTVGLTAGQATQ